MELVNLDPKDQTEKLFEYNSFPIDQVQNIWFTAWVEHAQLEFNLKVTNFGQKMDTIQKLAQLFKESYEVIKFSP